MSFFFGASQPQAQAARPGVVSAADPMDDDERAGRVAFDRWRFSQGDRVVWDWADMQPFEKRLWIDRSKGLAEPPV